MKDAIYGAKGAPPIGPYPQAIRANGFVFVSGQLPLDPSGTIVEGGIREQVQRALHNIAGLLEAAGSSMDKVVRCVVFLKDMDDYATMNEAYAKFFPGKLPARTTVAVARLPKDCLIEIEATALQ